eukprot:CAMPEP_0176485304 /NCGR_PEP_ID=MMETSP0200_2-20121128/4969_1 /TAXON_ID=947934 /ORGANISM="Chaetoceros sp., Strain GSL56" /LENGTH=530 /DNA_ID=CAMNT_0017881941 /DNA_START=129 /DNA_END=1721 /DNA_ORIENTATION=-
MKFNQSKLPFILMTTTMSSYTIRMGSSLTTFINLKDPLLLRGKFLSRHRESLEVIDPSATLGDIEDGTAVIALVEAMDRSDAKKAIEESSKALKKWKFHTSALERSKLLNRLSTLITENADDIARIMTLESGKPLKESLAEVGYGTSFIDFYAGEAIRSTSAGGGHIYPSPFSSIDGSPRGKIMAIQEAVGVTAMITPWNFPIAMIARKLAPALAAGCTVVLKPSELTPLTAIAVKELANRAGIPDEVFQLIISNKDHTPGVGEEFCTNPIVKKISFTGSTAVGKLLMKQSSDTIKRFSLELGGNAPFIVFEDADIDQAVHAAMASKFRNAGQTCVCADRFIIHKDIEEEFVQALHQKVQKIHVGKGLDEKTIMGPLIHGSAASSIKEKVDEAVTEGAECVIGGNLLPHLGPNFFEPTILRNVDPSSSRIWHEETFGPVIAMTTFIHEDQAIELANDTSSGLASYFCTKDAARIFRVSERLENGIVGINEGIISTAVAPFGGVKESGIGREGSPSGLAEYLETKYVYWNP